MSKERVIDLLVHDLTEMIHPGIIIYTLRSSSIKHTKFTHKIRKCERKSASNISNPF
ncbi:hypothetical protein Hanom_Chr04g00279641 [Helianthus anomalus]